jgi:putative SOS response-associated peptidase YedK
LKEPSRRCLVPVTKFCEWTAAPDPLTKRKSKVWFGHGEQPVFAFAGIWRPGDEGAFMAFLTCEPNATVGAVHPKAMLVMLDRSDYDRWLNDDHTDACTLAQPYADERMKTVA